MLDLDENSRMVEKCAQLARGGVEFILIREKHLPSGALATVSRHVIAAVRDTGTRVLVARRLDVALAIGADGVHLAGSPGELTPRLVRALMPDAFVSVSCHSLDEVRRARENGASAVLFAPVFGKTAGGVQVVDGVGVARLAEACATAGTMPVFALGGVDAGNAAACVAAGASGVAGIRMFF
jgi:thiamine-phosphate pyrophosphorylase